MSRDRIAVVPPNFVSRPAVNAAVAAAGALQLRRFLVEEHTRRELLSLVGPMPIYRSPPAGSAPLAASQGIRQALGDERVGGTYEAAIRRPGAAPGLAPLDVERLTDQVVRRIDEQILAYRERMGKAH
jgi:hypothetical protein